MRTTLWTKIVVISIILFLGTGVVPAINGNIEHNVQGSQSIKTMQLSSSALTFDQTSIASLANPDELPIEKIVSNNVYVQSPNHRPILESNNTMITQPLDNDIYRTGDLIDIEGTADGANFQYYTVDWGIGENPSQWNTTGITLTNDGQEPIANNTLATWNTNFATTANYYTLRLTVNYTTSQDTALIIDIYIDPALKQGWPQHIPFEWTPDGLTYYWAGLLEPAVADINNDGYSEIIAYKGGNPPKLDCFSQDGTLLWEAPVGNTDSPGGNLNYPVIGDVNNDGYDEIVVFHFLHFDFDHSQVYVFGHNGAVLLGWPVTLPKEFHATIIIADVNNDGYRDIIFKGNDAKNRMLIVLDHTGSIITQFPLYHVNWGSFIEPCPTVGNFDSDPELEIVTADPSEYAGYNSTSGQWNNTGVIHVYNLDGTEIPGWPVYTPGVIFSSPVTADINNDGYPEIIVGLEFAGDAPNPDYGGLYVYDHNGYVLPGFPFEKGWNFASTPAVADFDNDGYLEITASRLGFYTYVIHHDGTLAAGWPQTTIWNDYYSTIAGDVDGDHIPDIVTTAGNGFCPIYQPGGVYAWKYDGTPIPGFPKVTEGDAQAPATIADIDNDGKVEIIASSDWDMDFQTASFKERGTLYVWDINTTYNQTTMLWPTFHLNTERTGMIPTSPMPYLIIGNITGGFFKIKSTINNIGTAPATTIQWNITLTGGLILIGRKTTRTISTLNPSMEQIIMSKAIIGFGKTVITITAAIPRMTVTKQQNATVRLFFIHTN